MERREDVKARDKELIDNPEFAITIGKATYTERVDGGTMMLESDAGLTLQPIL